VAAVDYLADVGRSFGAVADEAPRRAHVVGGFDAIRSHEAGLSRRFLEGLATIPGARLYGIGDPARADERTPTFAVRVGDQSPLESSTRLGERGVFTWDGHYYALELMERLGLEPDVGGALRIGYCHYNTPEEVDRVLAELRRLSPKTPSRRVRTEA
jgi:selenocysteine lyase/cysteine desulfurase